MVRNEARPVFVDFIKGCLGRKLIGNNHVELSFLNLGIIKLSRVTVFLNIKSDQALIRLLVYLVYSACRCAVFCKEVENGIISCLWVSFLDHLSELGQGDELLVVAADVGVLGVFEGVGKVQSHDSEKGIKQRIFFINLLFEVSQVLRNVVELVAFIVVVLSRNCDPF